MEAEQLTQQRLEELWNKLIDKHKGDETLYELIHDKKVKLVNNNLFNIIVSNMLLDSNLRRYQGAILSFMREQTGNENLKFDTEVQMVQMEAMTYLPDEKYKEMTAINPALQEFRKLFKDIDFDS